MQHTNLAPLSSSANEGFPVYLAIVTAFLTALYSNVDPSSSTSGHPGKSSIVSIEIGIPDVILFISSIFFLFLVASTISILFSYVYFFYSVYSCLLNFQIYNTRNHTNSIILCKLCKQRKLCKFM